MTPLGEVIYQYGMRYHQKTPNVMISLDTGLDEEELTPGTLKGGMEEQWENAEVSVLGLNGPEEKDQEPWRGHWGV